jgi:hypothetical protein
VLKALFLLGLVFGLALPTYADESDTKPPIDSRFSSAHITVDEWQKYLDEVKSSSTATCTESENKEYVCYSDVKTMIWIFTRPGHPAHPAVTVGVLVRNEGSVGKGALIQGGGHYAGDEQAFRTWWRTALDKQPKWAVWIKAFVSGG